VEERLGIAPEVEWTGVDAATSIAGGESSHAEGGRQVAVVPPPVLVGPVGAAPAPIPVLPEWSPIKVFGGYGAPLDVRKAARAGVPVMQHQHNAGCHQHGCSHAAHQLLAGIEAARNQFSDFWGTGCACFAF